jgi:hypothetical protein
MSKPPQRRIKRRGRKRKGDNMGIHPIIWATLLFSITCALFAGLDRRTAKLKERDTDQQRQIDELKRELEEMKRK